MRSFRRNERGAVMVVSLLLLLVMTILAISASQAARMQERMAGNLRDRDLAFQSAEAGLRAGERWIDAPTLTSAPYSCSAAPCKVYELGILPGEVAYELKPWWNTNAWDYGTTMMIGRSDAAKVDPKYFIEEVEEVTDTLTIPPTGPAPSRIYYRITAHGQGGSETAEVVLQTTFARRFN